MGRRKWLENRDKGVVIFSCCRAPTGVGVSVEWEKTLASLDFDDLFEI